MYNPIIREIVAREQHRDLIRQAEQERMARTQTVRSTTERTTWRLSLAARLSAVRFLFRMAASAK
jgi:hypothetical protein